MSPSAEADANSTPAKARFSLLTKRAKTPSTDSDKHEPVSARLECTGFLLSGQHALTSLSWLGQVTPTGAEHEERKGKGWTPYKAKIRAVGQLCVVFKQDLPDAAQVFTSFVPRMLHQQLISYNVPAGLQLDFFGEGRSVEAAVMFSDASGFTQVRAARARRPKKPRKKKRVPPPTLPALSACRARSSRRSSRSCPRARRPCAP